MFWDSFSRSIVLLPSGRAEQGFLSTSGGIGRRTGFRFRRGNPWGFKSLLVHLARPDHEINQKANMARPGVGRVSLWQLEWPPARGSA